MDSIAVRLAQVQALENGRGIQYLIDEAYKIMENPIVLFNMEYELLFYVKDIVTDDRFWNEIVDTGVFCEESIRFFLNECFIDAVANSKTIAFLTSSKLKYERFNGRVLNGYNNTVADLVIVACDRPLIPGDDIIFEAVCNVITREIRPSEYYKSYGIRYHEKLICKLLDNDICDRVICSGHLSNLYEDLKTNLYVIAADIGERSADRNKLCELRDLFKETQPELKYAVYGRYIVIIASNDEQTLDIKKDLHKLDKYFAKNNIRTGISSGFDNLYNLREYYDEAVESLGSIR